MYDAIHLPQNHHKYDIEKVIVFYNSKTDLSFEYFAHFWLSWIIR